MYAFGFVAVFVVDQFEASVPFAAWVEEDADGAGFDFLFHEP